MQLDTRPPLTQAELLEQSAFIIGKVDDLVAKVDGTSVADLAGLRVYLEHLDSITFEAAGDNPFAGGYEGSSRTSAINRCPVPNCATLFAPANGSSPCSASGPPPGRPSRATITSAGRLRNAKRTCTGS